ncbi:MAG: hypothetical protein HAW65_00105, partial [Alphaproteobacteria bacterium]|nr:hypothetical protein [Alphaproteobacteria bacterium]
EETAEEIQNRARDHLDRENAALSEKRVALGVSDALAEIKGLTPAMLVRLGENEIKSLDDFAGCATDDLTGWVEMPPKLTAARRARERAQRAREGREGREGEDRRNASKPIKHDGFLVGFDIAAPEAETMIMTARVAAGWITQAEVDEAKRALAEAQAQAQAEIEAEAEAAEEASAETLIEPPAQL